MTRIMGTYTTKVRRAYHKLWQKNTHNKMQFLKQDLLSAIISRFVCIHLLNNATFCQSVQKQSETVKTSIDVLLEILSD